MDEFSLVRLLNNGVTGVLIALVAVDNDIIVQAGAVLSEKPSTVSRTKSNFKILAHDLAYKLKSESFHDSGGKHPPLSTMNRY